MRGSLTLVLLLGACARDARPACADRPNYYNPYYETDYTVRATVTTPKGIALDPSGLPINPRRVDRLFDEVEACLAKNFGRPPAIPDDVFAASKCGLRTFSLTLLRSCITVKVASDWIWNKTRDGQLLPLKVPGVTECKGATGDCYWRAAIQDKFTLVVTPSMYLLKDVLIRLVTSCADPWTHSKMAECAAPSTGPTDDGSGP